VLHLEWPDMVLLPVPKRHRFAGLIDQRAEGGKFSN
jgi:hypothetical protein